jgi:nucleolar protein 4
MFKQKDKRNTYLLKEGFIRSDSQAAKNLAPVELNRRQQSYYDRKRQLERFPHLFVSTTRLSIRNLPKHIDDHELKKLANSAVIGYRDRLTAQFNDGSLGKSEKQEYRHLVDDEQLMMTVRVKQAKVIRDQSKTDRVSSETAAAKPVNVSKGYGFVEFTRHSHALACLRHLNNNPDIFGGNRRLLVEFAIENSQILKRRQTRTMPPANFMDVKQKDTTTTGKERPIAKAKGDKLAQSQCHRKLSSPQDLERTQKQAPKRKRPVAIDDFDILVAKYKNRLASDPQSTSAVNNRWS